MTKRQSDLKERMKALKVSEPLKLKSELVFKAPASRNEVPLNEAPQVTKSESSVSIGSSGVPPQNELAIRDVPQNEVAQNEKPKNEAAPREHAPMGAPQREQPQNEVPHKEISGFFKLSHRVFFEPMLRDLSGDAFRLFLWLSSRAWRYPSSDGTVRASVSYMSHATISRGLKTLKEKGLVSIVEVDFKRGNLWQVSSVACNGYPDSGSDGPQKKAPQNEGPQTSAKAASNRASDSLKTRQPVPQNEGDLRSLKNIKNKKEVLLVPIVDIPAANEPEEVLASFEQELPAEQRKELIGKFVEREFPHGFYPPERVVKNMAARDWWRNQQAERASA